MGKSLTTTDPEADLGNVAPDELATNEEATAIPVIAGEARLAVRWISPVYGQFTKEAPASVPGKK